MTITGCDSLRLGILKPNKADTLRLLSCIKISGCDSLRLGLLKTAQDLLRLDYCNSIITIGTQQWMDKNLDVVTYRNGDTIPQVTNQTKWDSLDTGAWCYYNNDPANGVIYGKLYNWYAVNDLRGLAPKGYHIPSSEEWTILINELGDANVSGGKMKTTGTTIWATPNTNATNQSGFAGLPGGSREPFLFGSTVNNGTFQSVGYVGRWWSTQAKGSTAAEYWFLTYNNGLVGRLTKINRTGLSVRCLRD